MRPYCWGTISELIDDFPDKCKSCVYLSSCIERVRTRVNNKYGEDNPSLRLGYILTELNKGRAMELAIELGLVRMKEKDDRKNIPKI